MAKAAATKDAPEFAFTDHDPKCERCGQPKSAHMAHGTRHSATKIECRGLKLSPEAEAKANAPADEDDADASDE